MENNHMNSPDFSDKKKQVFAAFCMQPKTMLMVAVETGIMRSNITWFVAEWQKQGSIQQLKQRRCKISKHRAGYYTTDTKLFI